MKKRISCLLLAVVLILAMTPAALASEWSGDINYYSDVPTSHWCYGAIMTLSARGIVSGSGGKYRPGDSVTKAAALKMVINSLDIELMANPSGSGKWYDDYLYTAQQLGAVDDAFAKTVQRNITRLGMAQLMANLSGLKASEGAESPFADCSDPAAVALYEQHIALGSTSNGKRYFNGGRTLSRGEMAVFCMRLMRVAQTQRARELAQYYNLPADISFVEQPTTRQEFIHNVLIEFVNGNYIPTFFYDTPERVQAICAYMNTNLPSKELRTTVYTINNILASYPALGSPFVNLAPFAQYDVEKKMLGIRYEFEPPITMGTIYAQQVEALKFAKNVSKQMREDDKISGGMTQMEIVQAYFDWVKDFNVEPAGGSQRGGPHNVANDSAYSAFINKKANCAGRAAAFALLMGLEEIPCLGLGGWSSGNGHLLNYLVLDGEAYIVDPWNVIFSTAPEISHTRFQPEAPSLEYANAHCLTK